jgi:hypothetical protein
MWLQLKATAEEEGGEALSESELWEVYASTIENRLGDPISAARFVAPHCTHTQIVL